MELYLQIVKNKQTNPKQTNKTQTKKPPTNHQTKKPPKTHQCVLVALMWAQVSVEQDSAL